MKKTIIFLTFMALLGSPCYATSNSHLQGGFTPTWLTYLILSIHDFELPSKYMIIVRKETPRGMSPETPKAIIKTDEGYRIERKENPRGMAPDTPIEFIFTNDKLEVIKHYPFLAEKL